MYGAWRQEEVTHRIQGKDSISHGSLCSWGLSRLLCPAAEVRGAQKVRTSIDPGCLALLYCATEVELAGGVSVLDDAAAPKTDGSLAQCLPGLVCQVGGEQLGQAAAVHRRVCAVQAQADELQGLAVAFGWWARWWAKRAGGKEMGLQSKMVVEIVG